ncbi:MAG: phosphoribosyl-AMP cyclohydrolase [Verrucomicrobia bacterium]|nr:MAG: phosphoribosyl-AMP cyclohydrolase [Verrucomicrobiota bacterium]
MSSDLINPRTSHEEIETGLKLQPKFDRDGLIPCITADADSGEVLMFAFMNEEALRLTIRTGKATYYSRSRRKLWLKGEESGNRLTVMEVRVDCDQDVVLLLVNAEGGAACHNGFRSCFYRAANSDGTLEHVGGERLFNPEEVYGKK